MSVLLTAKKPAGFAPSSKLMTTETRKVVCAAVNSFCMGALLPTKYETLLKRPDQYGSAKEFF